METPTYIKSLLMPNGKKPAGRKVWSIDLELVWLPFFTATNTMGETAIPSEAIGCPLRLGYNPDGSVKFSKSGRPVMKVAKELGESVRLVRENFSAGLQAYAQQVVTDNPDGYKVQVEQAQIAGEPIIHKDSQNLTQAIAKAMEEAVAKPKRERAKEPVTA